jgi:hypothetical protein
MRFLPWIGAAVFFFIAQVVMHYYGTVGGVVALVPMLGLWWWSHILKEKKMDRLYSELMKLDHEKRTEVIADLSPEDRDAILKRRAKDLRPNQQPQQQRP